MFSMHITPGALPQASTGSGYRPLERTETDREPDVEQQQLETDSPASSGSNKQGKLDQEFGQLVADLRALANQQLLDKKTVEVERSAGLAVIQRRLQSLAETSQQGVGSDRPPAPDLFAEAGTPPHLQYLAGAFGLHLELNSDRDRFVFSYMKDTYEKDKPPQPEAPVWFEHELFAALSDNKLVYMPIYVFLCSSPFLTSWGSVME